MDAESKAGLGRSRLVGLPGGGSSERDEIELAHRATEELRSVAALMTDAQRIANFGSWEWKVATDEVSWSEQLYRILGLDPHGFDATLQAYLDHVHVEDREEVAGAIQGSLENGRPFRVEHRVVRPGGDTRTVRCHGEPIRDAAGALVRVVGVCQDVTELTQSELRRAEADARFRSAFEHAPIGVALIDFSVGPDGRLFEVNHELCKLTGRSEPELLGLSLSDLFPAEDRAIDLAVNERLLTGELDRIEAEKRCVAAGGRIIWVQLNISVVRTADGLGHGIAQVQDITERKQFEEQLRYVADHDSLTGILNRRRFREELESQIAFKRRYGGSGAVLVVDVDRLKQVNDTRGHGAGDTVLRTVADALRKRVRNTDVVSRLAGDEFAVMLPTADLDEAERVAGDLLQRLAAHDVSDWNVSASIGVSCFDGKHASSADEVIALADAAMYRAKQRGGATFAVADSPPAEEDEPPAAARSAPAEAPSPLSALSDAIGRRRGSDRPADAPSSEPTPATPAPGLGVVPSMEGRRFGNGDRASGSELQRLAHHAVSNDGLLLYAQPVLDLRSGRIAHHELLVRMHDQGGSVLAAGEFLTEASERDGLCEAIDLWVVRSAVRLLDGPSALGRLQVNLSAETLASDAALDAIIAAIGEGTFEPGALGFEVGEQAIGRDVSRASLALGRLASSGSPIVLDGFSAGFGSFEYLQRLPLEQIKIAGSVVRDLQGERPDHSTLRAIVRLARGTDRQTVATLVDSEGLLPLLRMHGVDMAQGYELGEPAPLAG